MHTTNAEFNGLSFQFAGKTIHSGLKILAEIWFNIIYAHMVDFSRPSNMFKFQESHILYTVYLANNKFGELGHNAHWCTF